MTKKTAKKPAAKSAKNHEKQGFFHSWTFVILVCVVLPLLFRSLFYAPFHIPSGSMKSSLLIGDFIFVSKFEYGYSRYSFPLGLKLFDGRINAKQPERGDIIVFRPPPTPKIDFIKRLIGLPGDRIKMVDGMLYINGKAVPRERIDDFIDEKEDGSVKRIKQYVEILPGGVRHFILDEDPFGQLDNTDEFVVPEGHYFFMGDNRDNSSDSRTKVVGMVPFENLVGKAKVVVFSNHASIIEPWKWFTSFRSGRLWLGTKEAQEPADNGEKN